MPSFLSYHPSLSSSSEPGYGKQPSANLALSNASSAGTADWLSDTGANQHVTPDLANLTSSNYISIMIIYMSVMVRDFPYLISGILKYRHHIVLSLCLTFFMSYILRNLCFLFRNFILITMFILNFTLFFMSRISMLWLGLLSCQFLKLIGLLTYMLLLINGIVDWIILLLIFSNF
jgi:hypothetical protein